MLNIIGQKENVNLNLIRYYLVAKNKSLKFKILTMLGAHEASGTLIYFGGSTQWNTQFRDLFDSVL